jgi:DNA-binding transcriptional MerR regulator
MPQAVGLSLQEVRQVLAIADRDDQPCGHVVSILQARLDQVRATLAELTSLGNHLAALLEHAQTAAPVEEAGVC